jgi:hypothetical protein
MKHLKMFEAFINEEKMDEAMANKESLHAFWDKTIDSCETEKEWLKKATDAGFSEADAKKLADDLEQGGDSYIAWAKEVFVNEGEI